MAITDTPRSTGARWQSYQDRFRSGKWRGPIFRDIVLDDIRAAGEGATVLDIGCGHGFDGDIRLQRSLAESGCRYIGVEPDTAIAPGEHVSEVYRALFEDAPIPPGSLQVAFAVMVLEHVAQPQRFWDKAWEVLADGGVFWGFTMDGRHRFCQASALTERLGLKDLYLHFLRGQRGTDRYENYPVQYRCNTPAQIAPCAAAFRECEFISFTAVGQLNYFIPRPLRPLTNCLDRLDIWLNRPGSLLAVRAVK